MRVVGAAPELEITRDGFSTIRIRDHMVEFKKTTLQTLTARSDERAATAVALPDLSLDYCRNVP
jgi:hypothetical protein